MIEYIDRIAFRSAIDGIHPFDKEGQKDPKWDYAKREFLTALAKFTPADVVERKTGVWIGEGDGYADGNMVYDMWSCSVCGEYFDEWDDKPTWNFCPNCGAQMIGSDGRDLPKEETITFTMDDASMQNFLKLMEQLDAENRRRMFEPGNRIDLICGDKKITYVAEGWSDADLP